MSISRVLALVLLALLYPALPVAARDGVDPPDPPHIRIVDERLRALFEAGLRESATLRALASRLEASDVVVYLERDPWAASSFGGRLTFLSIVGGYRYLVVRLVPLASPVQQVAMIGHELQHAVEVADNPAIVDAGSLFREYQRFGYLNGVTTSGVAVDSRAAIEAGVRVGEELRAGAKDAGKAAD